MKATLVENAGPAPVEEHAPEPEQRLWLGTLNEAENGLAFQWQP
jgi:hypothetical protein